MPIRDPLPLLRLAEPPPGYSFHAGVWLTHDLAWTAVCDLLAPALAGVTTTGERRIQDTRAALGAGVPGLVVLHAGGAFTPEGPVLPWATARAVTGRRQHAKAAILQFRKGGRILTRAIVTSANLTDSGLRTNRELVAWDERGASSTSAFLGVDLVQEIRKLIKTFATGDDLKAVLRVLAKPLVGQPPTGELYSSLTEPGPLLDFPPETDRAVERIVIVSPSFAGNTDTKAAALLTRWCDKKTRVDIYAGYNGTAAAAAAGAPGLMLSAGLRTSLEKAATLRILAVPNVDDDGTNARYLHAKLFAFVTADGRAELFVGSANCTGPGLGGANREMLVRSWTWAAALDRSLTGLGAVEFPGEITLPPKMVPSSSVPEQPTGEFTFVIGPGGRADDASWNGTMTITGLTAGATVTYQGERIAGPGPIAMVLDPRVGFVEVSLGGPHFPLTIQVNPPPGDDEFWDRLTAETEIDRPDRSLERFLNDMQLAATRTPRPPSTGKAKTTAGDDGFSIPAEQRLVRLARHRRSLAARSEEAVRTILGTFLATEPPEAQAVADTIDAAYRPGGYTGSDPLLEALSDSLAAFDALGGPDGP